MVNDSFGKSAGLTWMIMNYRSSHRECSLRKGVLRNFAKFMWKHLCQILAKVFSCEFCEIYLLFKFFLDWLVGWTNTSTSPHFCATNWWTSYIELYGYHFTISLFLANLPIFVTPENIRKPKNIGQKHLNITK